MDITFSTVYQGGDADSRQWVGREVGPWAFGLLRTVLERLYAALTSDDFHGRGLSRMLQSAEFKFVPRDHGPLPCDQPYYFILVVVFIFRMPSATGELEGEPQSLDLSGDFDISRDDAEEKGKEFARSIYGRMAQELRLHWSRSGMGHAAGMEGLKILAG